MIKDNHNHIILADIDSMVASAKARAVKEFSITEHISQFREPRESIDFGSIHLKGRIFDSLKEYDAEFANFNDLNEIKIKKGLEVDYSPRYEKKVADYVNQERFEILLCSVHELEDRTDIQRPKSGNPRQMWLEYLRLEKEALESDFIPFNVLTHPVRMAQGSKEYPEEIDDLLLDLAKTAKKRNRALELNGSDLNFSPDLVRRLALACSKAVCIVSVGSDAHYPQDVSRNMAKAAEIAEEFGLKVL
ncbi:MAG: PHP domain-containing protein [Nitrososphaerales archaeon]